MEKRIFSALTLTAVALLAGCNPRLVEVMPNGSIVPDNSAAVVDQARANGEAERAIVVEQRGAAASAALASCVPSICDAITRGEIAVGMTEAQVLAATRTGAGAWDTRLSGSATVMSPRLNGAGVSDAVGEVAFVSLQNGRVESYTYREAQGFRNVASPADATLNGRADSMADALLQQGDQYAAAGRLDLALARYDQADVIRPGDPDTNFRIASALDKELRPYEALMRYQLFVHQMQLELIDAKGDAAAKIAEAIARAHERIIVLERR